MSSLVQNISDTDKWVATCADIFVYETSDGKWHHIPVTGEITLNTGYSLSPAKTISCGNRA